MKNNYHRIFTLLLFSIVSCTGIKYQAPTPVTDQDRLTNFREKLQHQYSADFSANQRIILQIRNKHYDFLGYLAMNRNSDFRATAFSDMGGRFIDFVHRNDSTRILHNPAGLLAKPVRLGVVEDILHLYRFNPGKTTYLTAAGGDSTVLVNYMDDDNFETYRFSGDDKLTYSRVIKAGSLVREARYKDYKQFEKFSETLPAQIKLTNYLWGYDLEINLLDIKPVINSDKVFPERNAGGG